MIDRLSNEAIEMTLSVLQGYCKISTDKCVALHVSSAMAELFV